MITYKLNEIDQFNFYGRNALSDEKCTFFWTGSGLEFCMTGGELWIEMEVPAEVLPPWVCIYLNGIMLGRQQLITGKHKICIFSKMDPKVIKKIRIRKESPAVFDDHDCFFSICSISLEGNLKGRMRQDKKIEFIGDSITSGEGLSGHAADCIRELHLYSSRPDRHYAEKIGEEFQADLRIISQSGWGVYSSYDNRVDHSLPAVYPYICKVVSGDKAKRAGAWRRYDNKDWQADAVIINLGTNDAAAFENPEWVDMKSDFSYKQHKNSDGSFREEDSKKLKKGVSDFLFVVRSRNPQAVIIWVYGMLKNQVAEIIKAGISEYQNEYHDRRLMYLSLPDTLPNEFGSLGHPGSASHMRAAEMLCVVLRKWL